MSSRKKPARVVGTKRRSTRLASATTENMDEKHSEQEEESEEEDETTRQQKRMRLQYSGVDQKELDQDKLFASPSEKSSLEPILKRAVRNGSLARVFASSPHISELVQDAMNRSLLLSKTHQARTMQVRQDASGNTETELEQLTETVSVTKYHRYTDWDGGGEERVEALLTIGADPNHSIRFEIHQGPHEFESYASFGMTHFSLQYTTPAQYQDMMTHWGLKTTSVDEIPVFLEQLGDKLDLRF